MINKDELGVLVQRGNELLEASRDADPTSETAQLAAIYKKARDVNDAIEAETKRVNENPNLSDTGRIAALREYADKEATALEAFVDEYLTPREQKVIADAEALGGGDPLTPDEARLVDNWLRLPPERRDEIRDRAITGRDPELARALVKERDWITGIAPNTPIADRLHAIAFPGFEDKKQAVETRAKSLNHTRRYVDYVINRAKGT